MPCEFPYMVKNTSNGLNNSESHIPVPCGKCYDCKMRTVSQWALRLRKEDEISSASYFVTLTYDTQHVPISPKGFMTLDKTDVQKFIKRLRRSHPEGKQIRYFAVGEYGTNRDRPHYHIIIFNSEKPRIFTAWMLNNIDLGGVHIGDVSGASVAYTLKYMIKESRIPKFHGDDRQKEFRIMSKGLGKNYLSEQMVKWHKSDQTRLYTVIEDGIKVPLPRYFREKIWTEEERQKQNLIVKQKLQQQNDTKQEKFERRTGKDYRKHKLESAEVRTRRAFNSSKKRGDL